MNGVAYFDNDDPKLRVFDIENYDLFNAFASEEASKKRSKGKKPQMSEDQLIAKYILGRGKPFKFTQKILRNSID